MIHSIHSRLSHSGRDIVAHFFGWLQGLPKRLLSGSVDFIAYALGYDVFTDRWDRSDLGTFWRFDYVRHDPVNAELWLLGWHFTFSKGRRTSYL